MENKKGQQMTLGTIVLIVLGIAVLVFLIFGFSTGWGNLWERVTAFGGGSANVDTIVQACALACTGQSSDAYCNQEKTVRYGVKKRAWNGTGMSNVTSSIGTCFNMTNSEKYPGVGVAPCGNLCD